MKIAPDRRTACVFVVALVAAPAVAAPPAPSWSYEVKLDPRAGTADVTLRIATAPGFTPTRVCADMGGAGRFVSDVQERVGDAHRPLARDPDPDDRDDCFPLFRGARRGEHDIVEVRYHHDLAAMAARIGDPDYAARFGDDWILSDEALLLRPDPMPEHAPIALSLALPDGLQVASVWSGGASSAPGTSRFTSDSDQFDAGSYLAIGHLRTLPPLALGDAPRGNGPRGGGLQGNATVRVVLVDRPHRASDDVVRDWLARAFAQLVRFYGALPAGPAHEVMVVLAPVAGQRDAGVFGSVLRRARPSVVLLFGAEAPNTHAAFAHDWVATHELFHLGNPNVEGRLPWFIEGYTTYYQDVLRARAGVWPRAVLWGDLAEQCRENANSDSAAGVSLAEASRHMRERHDWQAVYWGGACHALRVDVAIRERTHDARSLDDVMRALREAKAPLDEDEILAALDQATGDHVATNALRSTTPFDYRALFLRLGVTPHGEAPATLVNDPQKAPLAWIRRAIFGEGTVK